MDGVLVTPESVSIQRLVRDGRISRGAQAFQSAAVSPTRSRGDVQAPSRRMDLVDLSGLDAVKEAIRQYRGQEALPVPESVGKAIRSLVREVLDGLPHGRVLAF